MSSSWDEIITMLDKNIAVLEQKYGKTFVTPHSVVFTKYLPEF
jgi:hypothetical protein